MFKASSGSLRGAVHRIVCLGVLHLLTAVAVRGDQSVRLAWDRSPSPVAGYVVHCGLKSGDLPVSFSVDNVTETTVWGLVEGATYYFSVTACAVGKLESEPSNEVEYSVPTMGVTNTNSTAAFLLGAVSGTPPAKSILRVRTSGGGNISPNLAGAQLINGKTYTVTAVPAAGQVFAGWNGAAVSLSAKLSFVMKPGLVLGATFIPSPFIPVAGSYTGLFHEEDAVRPGTAGFFTVTSTSRGTYSGRLQTGTSRYSFSGSLDLQCRAVNAIKRKNAAPLTVEVEFGSDEPSEMISGRVTDTNWTAQLIGDRAVFNVRTNPAPFAGSYTLAILGVDEIPAAPTGDGFGVVRVTASGIATVAGALADGVRLAQSAPLSQDGVWPLYVPLYTGKGLVMGWVTFASEQDSDLNAGLSWIKPAGARGAFYPAGFNHECKLIGSRYTRPASSTNSVLGFTDATVTFIGGNLAADFTNAITLGLNSRVTNLSSNRLALNFSLATGTFTGSAADLSSGKPRSFMGAVLQKQNVGAGFLLGTNLSSRVRIGR
jgi:hypothetical protein